MKYPRNVRIFRGQLDASPFVGVLFLVAIFLLLNSSLVFLPGIAVRLPEAADQPGVTGPIVTVAVDTSRRLYYRNQIIKEADLQIQLRKVATETKTPLTLVLMADKSVPYETIVHLAKLAREAGLKDAIFATSPPVMPVRTNSVR
ncbi:MAG TPA: biopolymer transporter ExbD [Candidatus Angelobacter sp.]|nr:biopolymer transporter ExbD [Candidatus Angelobacter sp.]